MLLAYQCEFLLYAGTAVITNFEPLIADEWTTAVAELNYREGSLVVNDGIAAKGLFYCHTLNLSLNIKDVQCRLKRLEKLKIKKNRKLWKLCATNSPEYQ